ncbi:MAG: hypothetical protein ACXU8N_07180 [Telluria sp.]
MNGPARDVAIDHEQRITAVEANQQHFATKADLLETEQRLRSEIARLDLKIAHLELKMMEQFAKLDERFNRLEVSMYRMNAFMKSWILGTVLSIMLALFGAVTLNLDMIRTLVR